MPHMAQQARSPLKLPTASKLVADVALVLLVATCGAQDRGSACVWPPEAETPEDSEESECIAEPAGQICDRTTQRCQSVCDPSEYLLTCRTQASVPIPVPSLKCGPLRAPVPLPSNEAMYCCPCTG